ncbi:MAG: beta-lactamase family protein [Phycisphaerae bacterium]|nr:beta-lactamase family protein [Phycisphaerae bacterium]
MRRVLAVVVVAALTTPTLAIPPSELKAKVEEHLAPLLKTGEFAYVVGVLTGGQEHVFAYGTLATDSQQLVDGDTIFETGSVGKTFTALALADMVHHKLVKYDDAVQQYLAPDCRMPTRGGKQITLEHLATHTSGLPNIPPELALFALFSEDPYARYTPACMCQFLGTYKLPRDIGAAWKYSNLGAGLLGYALARHAAGGSYERLIVERICKPLGMRDTCITLSPDQKRRLAKGYDEDGEPAAYWHDDALAGSGALLSSAKDMLRYATAQIGTIKTPLDAAIQDTHHPRVSETEIPDHAQALGWLAIVNAEGQARVHWHDGETGGFHSFVGFIKPGGVAVVVLTNRATGETTVAGLRLLIELARSSPASSRSAD